MDDIAAFAGAILLVVGGVAALGGCDREPSSEATEHEVQFDEFDEPAREEKESASPPEEEDPRADHEQSSSKTGSSGGEDDEASAETAETEIQVLGVERNDDQGTSDGESSGGESATASADGDEKKNRGPKNGELQQIQIQKPVFQDKLRGIRPPRNLNLPKGSGSGNSRGGGSSN